VLHVVRYIRSRWDSVIFFVVNEKQLFLEYAILLVRFPSWSPADVKAMTPRERAFWLEMSDWLIAQRARKVNPYVRS
jgi:hypothetical protein